MLHARAGAAVQAVAAAKELRNGQTKFNAAAPGHTATHLNGHRSDRTVDRAAAIAVRLAILPDDGPIGTFQNDDGIVAW